MTPHISNHRPATTTRRGLWSRLVNSKPLAAVTSVALLAGPFLLVSSADAAEVIELTAKWRTTDTDVENGSLQTLTAHTNVNDTLGEEGSKADHTLTFVFDHALITKLPVGCKTSGVTTPSDISTDGHTLTCNVGNVRYGTAAVVDVDVRVEGDGGDQVTATVSTDDAPDVDLDPLTITAEPGVDIVFDASTSSAASDPTGYTVSLPANLAVPVGAAPLDGGPLTFDVTITNDTTTNIPSNINRRDADCVLASDDEMSTLARTQTKAPLPSTCTVQEISSGVFRVTLDGYKTSLIDPPTQAANGDALPTDRVVLAAFALSLGSTVDPNPTPGTFFGTVSNVQANTVGGDAAPESDTTNNRETVTIRTPGAISAAWGRFSINGSGSTNAIQGQGVSWDASPDAVAGETLVAQVTNATLGGRLVSGLPNSARIVDCIVLDDKAHFTGRVSIGSQDGRNYHDWIPQSSIKYSYYTGSVGASGNRDDFDCSAHTFGAASATYAGTAPGGRTDWYDLDIADPSDITALKVTVDPTEPVSGVTVVPDRTNLAAVVSIDDDAADADEIWVLGSGNLDSGVWRKASDLGSLVTTVPNSQYPGTNTLRDEVNILPARARIQKDASTITPTVGDTITYTLVSALNTNTGTTQNTSWTVTDVLPAGLEYQPGSATPAAASVTANGNGTTTLVWNLTGQYNTDVPITYNATLREANGRFTNTAKVTSTHLSGYVPTVTNKGVDSVTVAPPNDGHTVLTKSIDAGLFAAGASNTWHLTLQNADTVDQDVTDIIDVLPWNGDERGTDFHGTYTITDVSSNTGETVYYTSEDPADINPDPADASNGDFGNPSAIWVTDKPTKVTAIRIVGGSLGAGLTKTNDITWDTQHAQEGDVYENIAYSRATNTELRMIKAASTATALDGAELKIDKAYDSREGWDAGDKFTYTVTVKNPSANDAPDVEVHDVPNGVAFDDMFKAGSGEFLSPSQGYVDVNGIWQVGNLAAGATATAQVTATLTGDGTFRDPVNLTYVENPSHPYTPAATGCVVNTNVDQDTDQCDQVVTPLPRLHVNKIGTTPKSDGTITWTVQVSNPGPETATGVVADDEYPDGLDADSITIVKAPTKGTFDRDSGVWNIGTLTDNEVVSISFKGKVSKSALQDGIVNKVLVTSPDVPTPAGHAMGICQINTNLASDNDACDAVFAGAPNLRIEKHSTDVDVDDGADEGTVTWKISVGNFGGRDANKVVVKDTLPEEADEDSLKVVKAPTQGKFNTDKATWYVGTLKPGETHHVTVSAKVKTDDLEDGVLNKATVTSPDDPYGKGTTTNKTLEGDRDQYDAVTVKWDPDKDGSGSSDDDDSDGDGLPGTGGPALWILVTGVALVVGGVLTRRFVRKTVE